MNVATSKEFFMNNDRKRKLELNRETIRALTPQEMAVVAGGALNAALAGYARPPLTQLCNTDGCPNSIGCPPVARY